MFYIKYTFIILVVILCVTFDQSLLGILKAMQLICKAIPLKLYRLRKCQHDIFV